MTTNGTKYTFVCDPDECDTLIEVTCVSGFDFPNGVVKHTCPCGREMSYISATILSSTNQTKEEKMETTETSAVTVPDTYNSNLLVTYKVIRGYSDAEYATDKVVNIEWELHNGRESQKKVTLLHSKIDTVKEIITEAYEDSEDQDTLRAIAEALGIEMTKTVSWSASIEVSGTIEVDLLSPYDFDVESEITDSIYADSHHGNIEILDQEVCNVRED
jgi:hypothetical protein